MPLPVVEQISSLEILSVVEQIRSVENFVRCRVDQRGRFCPLSSKFQRGIFRPLSSKFQRGKFVRCRANQRGKLSVEEQISVENCPLSSKSSWKNCPLSSKSAWTFVRVPRVCAIRQIFHAADLLDNGQISTPICSTTDKFPR